MAHKRKQANKNIVEPTKKAAKEAKKYGIDLKTKKKVEKTTAEKKLELLAKDFETKYPVRCLSNFEVAQFKELLQLSNTAAGIFKEISDKEVFLLRIKETIKKIRTKEIEPPIFTEILPHISVMFKDMNKAIKTLTKNANELQNTITFSKGQVDHRYEEYVDAGRRMRDRLTEIFGDAPSKTISCHRVCTKSDKEQENAVEKGFDNFIKKEAEKEKTKNTGKKEEINKHTPQEVAKVIEDSWKEKQKKMSKK